MDKLNSTLYSIAYAHNTRSTDLSRLMGVMKGKSAIRVFSQFPEPKQRPYWGNHFWAEGYCVDTVGLDSERIKKRQVPRR